MKKENSIIRFVAPVFALFFVGVAGVFAQDEKGEKTDLGNKEYIIVKDYKPILAESQKISETPDGDSAVANPPVFNYQVRSQKVETPFEAATIKAVKIKDESLTKLYRSLLKLGVGNYSTYNGELYVHSLRSKKGALGLDLKHLSGSPGLKGVGQGDFSHNSGGIEGKYFLENATLLGNLSYDRHRVSYYGYNSDKIILSSSSTKQVFSTFGTDLRLNTRFSDENRLQYNGRFAFFTTSDSYDVTENEFMVAGGAGKQIETMYAALDFSFDYFKKSDANFQILSTESNLSRNIVNVNPSVTFNKDKAKLKVGAVLGIEKNQGSDIHLFPKVDLTIPIAENIVTIYANVDGGIRKNNFRTIIYENPFITSNILPKNTSEKLSLSGGLKGNFSNTISFDARVRYSSYKDLMLFYNDTVSPNNKFNILFDDGSLLNLHAEIAYRAGDNLNFSLHVDQNSYTMDSELKAWQKPQSEIGLSAKYNLRDKITVDAEILARGKYYARYLSGAEIIAQKVNGYADLNLGIEYRYSKILSGFVHLNNLGFSRYYIWNQYPSERFNILGGITYSF